MRATMKELRELIQALVGLLRFVPIWWRVEVRGETPGPERMVAMLRQTGMSDDQIVDVVKRVADKSGGWSPQLERIGLLALKPDAPEGQEKEA